MQNVRCAETGKDLVVDCLIFPMISASEGETIKYLVRKIPAKVNSAQVRGGIINVSETTFAMMSDLKILI